MMLKSGIIVAFFTLLSRIFGLARELFIADIFGSSQIADCVNVAFKFPNLFRRIFGEGALSAVFIPAFSKKLANSEDEAKKYSSAVFTLLTITLIALTIAMQLSMPWLMLLIAPGFYNNPEKYELCVLLSQITTPYLIFVSITALYGGILNAAKKFGAFAFSPIIMNISIILFTYSTQKNIAPHFGISFALIISGILQILFMYFFLIKAKLQFPLSFNFFNNKDVIELLKKMAPATISAGAQQLNLFLSQSIASFIPGAVSILSYADRLYQLPLSLIGVTFATILLPELSKIYHQQDLIKANKLQNQAIITCLALSLPATIGLAMLAHPIIHIIYERGAFLSEDTTKTAQALVAFAFGLPAFVLPKILMPIFYANGDTKTPLDATIKSLIANSILNIILMIPFEHTGIAIGSTLAGYYNTYILYSKAQKYNQLHLLDNTKKAMQKIIAACVILIFFLGITNNYANTLFYSDNNIVKISALFASILLASMFYSTVAYIFKIHTHVLHNK